MIQPNGENKELRPATANKQKAQPREPVECKCGTVYRPTKALPFCPQCFRRPPKV